MFQTSNLKDELNKAVKTIVILRAKPQAKGSKS